MTTTFTTAEIIERLEVLWRKLEDEGRYVSANTVGLAITRLIQADIKEDMPSPPASFMVREVPELSSGLGDGIRQTQADIKADASPSGDSLESNRTRTFECAARKQGTAGGNLPRRL